MEQFSLDKYLENPSRKVVTRDGRKARIICTDAMGDYPLIALVEAHDGTAEQANSFTSKGSYYTSITSDNDLFFAPEKHEGWINIYRSDSNGYYIRQSKLYNSKEEADEVAKINDSTFIKTLKIEWED